MSALPQWQCHKKVHADRIDQITHGEGEWPGHDTGTRWHLACGAVVLVTRDLIARGAPKVGDYFVQYADDYASWSPARAFTEGYSRLT